MWIATLTDGSEVSEKTHSWKDVKENVQSLGLVYNGIVHSLPSNQDEYMQAKTASAPLSGGVATIESRWIGCRTHSGFEVRLRFYEQENKVEVEAEG